MLPVSAFALEVISAEGRAPELFLQSFVAIPSWHWGLPLSQLLLLSPFGRTWSWSVARLEGLTTALWAESSCSSDYHSVALLLSNLSVYLWPRRVFTAVCRAFSSCGNGGLLCCRAQAFHRGAFSCCRAEAVGARAAGAVAHGIKSCRLQELWLTGFSRPQHVESSQTRGRTHVPCTGRRVLIHCTTREVLFCFFQSHFFLHKLFIQIFFFRWHWWWCRVIGKQPL